MFLEKAGDRDGQIDLNATVVLCYTVPVRHLTKIAVTNVTFQVRRFGTSMEGLVTRDCRN